MSYCRYGTDRGKSDVYIWGGKDGFNIWLSWDKAKELGVTQCLLCTTREETLSTIKHLRKYYGIHVPRCASRRLRKELFFEKHSEKFLVKHYLKYKERRLKRILKRLSRRD